MKQQWLPDELDECWSLTPRETEFISSRAGSNQLGFALFLKFFQLEGRFPGNHQDVPQDAVEYLSAVLDSHSRYFYNYNFSDRLLKLHRAEIRDFLGFRSPTNKDSGEAQHWLVDKAMVDWDTTHLHEYLRQWCLERRIEQPSHARKMRIIKAAIRSAETTYMEEIHCRLSERSERELARLAAERSLTISPNKKPKQPEGARYASSYPEISNNTVI